MNLVAKATKCVISCLKKLLLFNASATCHWVLNSQNNAKPMVLYWNNSLVLRPWNHAVHFFSGRRYQSEHGSQHCQRHPKKKSKSKMRANFQVPKLALNEGIYEHYSPNPTCDFFFDRGVTQLEAKSIWSKKCGRPPRNHRQPAFCLVSSSLFLISSSKRLSRQ